MNRSHRVVPESGDLISPQAQMAFMRGPPCQLFFKRIGVQPKTPGNHSIAFAGDGAGAGTL